MRNVTRQLQDGESGAGSVSIVTRQGDTIRRPSGPWTSSVHALLKHLATRGYGYAPQVLGADPQFETLTYIEGEVALRPWPTCLLDDSGLQAIAIAICEYHQAVSDFVPPPGSVWRCPDLPWAPGMIVRHGDLGPWNMVWWDGQLVGLIDWDLAEPGFKMDDIAQIAWHCVPLARPEVCHRCGIVPGPSQARRFAMLCEICGVSRDDVIHALRSLQRTEAERILRLGQIGVEPWTTFLARGDVSAIESDEKWLSSSLKTI
ncbi:MAG: aminoglycoside phosphotransferase family protein [Verrucomicrobiota bacterium]